MNVTDERLKLIFGFVLLLGLIVLALAIGLGKVEEKTSFGLNIILGGLITLAGGWSQYTFSKKSNEVKEDKENG